jgi:rhodanese-related sulfurtransferase
MKVIILISALLGLTVLAFNLQASGLAAKSSGEQTISTAQQSDQRHPAQDTAFMLEQSEQTCPPFCINPVSLGDGVRTVDELDLLKFMETSQRTGSGLIVDARSSSWYQRGTLPGSVNIPYTVFEKPENDVELTRVFEELGAEPRHDVGLVRRMLEHLGLFDGRMKTARWDFSAAKDLVLVCNDPWCGQSPRAIKALLSQGYPAEKLFYYRGGLKTWESLGLSTQVPSGDRLAAN